MFKNKRTNKYMSALLAIVIMLSGFCAALMAYGDESSPIAINEKNFPDRTFRSIISNYIDGIDGSTKDNYISQSEISGLTLLDLSGYLDDNEEIEDLKGIELFTDLKTLRCGGIGLTSLDVSQMPQLEILTCQGNDELETLDLSNNTNLKMLNCSDDGLTTLDLTNNTKLETLYCNENDLESIDVSALSNLTDFRCRRNDLTSLDVSKNTLLSTLQCSNNQLTSLDLSQNTLLKDVNMSSIGEQTVSAKARLDLGNIFVELKISNNSMIKSTSLDRIEYVNDSQIRVSGYDGVDFTPQSVDEIADGIDYYYDTGLDSADEYMNVHINVERDFHQVQFFADESKSTLLATQLVNTGEDAQDFEITDVPQCKAFANWSQDITNVTDDIEVYAVWTDNHNFEITSFKDNIITIKCADCDDKTEQYLFSDLINKKSTDSEYISAVDLNNDGIINAKDYARLLKTFK
jgi:hypothetical protein